MDGLAAQLAGAHPDTNRGWGVTIVPLKEQFTSFLGPVLRALFAAVAILLLLGGLNVSSLALSRMENRRKEIAIRLALGAPGRRIFDLLWLEALLLAAIGSAAGLLFACAALPHLIGLLPLKLPIPIPGLENITMGGRAGLFAAGLAALASVLIVSLPGLRIAAADPGRRLKESGSTHSMDRGRLRFFRGLIFLQTVFAVVLLAAAGVTVKSLFRLFCLDQGFEKESVLTFRTPLSSQRYPGAEDRIRAYDRFLGEVEQLPGVISAAVAYGTPLGGSAAAASFSIEGQPARDPAEAPRAGVNVIGPNYFRTLRIPLRSGRDFTSNDTSRSQPVAIISDSLARKYWGGRDPSASAYGLRAPRETRGLWSSAWWETCAPG